MVSSCSGFDQKLLDAIYKGRLVPCDRAGVSVGVSTAGAITKAMTTFKGYAASRWALSKEGGTSRVISGNTAVQSGLESCGSRLNLEKMTWLTVRQRSVAAFLGALGTSSPGSPAARSGTGSITGTSSLVFVSPRPSDHLPSILLPLRSVFSFAICAIRAIFCDLAPCDTRSVLRQFEM